MSKSQTRSCCYDQLIEEWDGPNLACRTVALPESPLESPRSSKWELKRLKFWRPKYCQVDGKFTKDVSKDENVLVPAAMSILMAG